MDRPQIRITGKGSLWAGVKTFEGEYGVLVTAGHRPKSWDPPEPIPGPERMHPDIKRSLMPPRTIAA